MADEQTRISPLMSSGGLRTDPDENLVSAAPGEDGTLEYSDPGFGPPYDSADAASGAGSRQENDKSAADNYLSYNIEEKNASLSESDIPALDIEETAVIPEPEEEPREETAAAEEADFIKDFVGTADTSSRGLEPGLTEDEPFPGVAVDMPDKEEGYNSSEVTVTDSGGDTYSGETLSGYPDDLDVVPEDPSQDDMDSAAADGTFTGFDSTDDFTDSDTDFEDDDDLDQAEAINKAEPSVKGKPEKGQNNALFLNRSKILTTVVGAAVAMLLLLAVIIPAASTKSDGTKKSASTAQAGKKDVPSIISQIPDYTPPLYQNAPDEEDTGDTGYDYSADFPPVTEGAAVSYSYNPTYAAPAYQPVEEIDSNADEQQVAFNDVRLVEDETYTLLKAQIASRTLEELEQRKKELEEITERGTWRAYRPATADRESAAADPGSAPFLGFQDRGGEQDGGIDAASLMMLRSLADSSSGENVDTYRRQNGQADKSSFRLQGAGGAGEYQYNDSTTVWKGTIIPAVLETAINTDLPGVVIATVTENVYSSTDGKYLLIPQGSKLFAEYSSSISYSQERVQIAWNTLIRPDGLEVSLGSVDGVDAQGHAGLPGRVSRHPFEYAKALGLIAIVTVMNTKAQNQIAKANEGKSNNYFTNTGEALYEQSSEISNRMIENALDIQPTITVEAGQKINLIINVTMSLPPLIVQPPQKRYVRNH